MAAAAATATALVPVKTSDSKTTELTQKPVLYRCGTHSLDAKHAEKSEENKDYLEHFWLCRMYSLTQKDFLADRRYELAFREWLEDHRKISCCWRGRDRRSRSSRSPSPVARDRDHKTKHRHRSRSPRVLSGSSSDEDDEDEPAAAVPDPRSVLGLGSNFTREDVILQYRKLARAAHPDRGGDPAVMQALNAARDELLRRMDEPSGIKANAETDRYFRHIRFRRRHELVPFNYFNGGAFATKVESKAELAGRARKNVTKYAERKFPDVAKQAIQEMIDALLPELSASYVEDMGPCYAGWVYPLSWNMGFLIVRCGGRRCGNCQECCGVK